MMSTSVTCAPGFTRVCPMMEDVCPGDTMMMCPGGMPPAAGRMMHGSSGSSGCQCVPDFLMALVHHAMPAATRLDATDRATDVIKNEKVKLGKRTCTCTFTMETKGTRCSGQAKCDKKCTGTGAVDVDPYSFTLAVKKGKGKISKCTVAAMPTVGPVEPTGSGSGPVPTGSGTGPVPPTGSGSGMENPMSRCTCVGKSLHKATREANPEADPYLLYGGYYGHGLGYAHYGYGYPYSYGHLGYWGRKRRSAEAEPAADPKADPYLLYGGYYGYGHGLYGGYHGYPYAYWG